MTALTKASILKHPFFRTHPTLTTSMLDVRTHSPYMSSLEDRSSKVLAPSPSVRNLRMSGAACRVPETHCGVVAPHQPTCFTAGLSSNVIYFPSIQQIRTITACRMLYFEIEVCNAKLGKLTPTGSPPLSTECEEKGRFG